MITGLLPGLKAVAARVLPRAARRGLQGLPNRLAPISDHWGFDRGTPVDRFYIERFLQENRADIRGRVLEVMNADYTHCFGQQVSQAEVVDIDSTNPLATIVADLAKADSIASDQYDCFVLTETLQLIFDFRSAVEHAHRILKPGGVLLVTVPTVSRLVHDIPDYWRFTEASCAALFEGVFGKGAVTVRTDGNLQACTSFLTGMSKEELTLSELETNDPAFPLMVTVRAVKRATPAGDISAQD